MPGVYLSWPFCAQKCSFCNFASGVFPRELEGSYASALVSELRNCHWSWRPETVYLGGGTPSRMDSAVLRDILAAIPGRPWREATVEAAPGSLAPEAVRAWAELGINRVSLGVQSFVKKELASTGRRHDAAAVEADCRLLRDHGIAEINIDLIAGLPWQNEATWRESLDWIERLAPPHVSVYLFEIDEDSRLGLEVLQGGGRYSASSVPEADRMAELYEIAVERLGAMGIQRYEISNFARPGHESLHNLKYWLREPYLGFGADAHSCEGGLRWGNVESAAEYVRRVEAGQSPALEAEPVELQAEKFFVGLRLMEGIEPSPEDRDRYALPIERLQAAGLLESDGQRLRLTARGVLISNEVFAEFID